MANNLPAGAQFGRAARLVVSGAQSYIDLSAVRFRFDVYAADTEAPNTAQIRIYNLSQTTLNQIVGEYTSVILEAGYTSNVAVIFSGTIKQFRRGKEDNVTSYLDIMAADGDILYNFGVSSVSLPPDTTPSDLYEVLCKKLDVAKDKNTVDFLAGATGGIIPDPKGKVAFGMFRTMARQLANTVGGRWSIQNGKFVIIPLTGYLPSTPVRISSATGMVGVPEACADGITVSCLLNPLIAIGQLVEIDDTDITEWIIRQQGYPNYNSISYAPAVQPGLGKYRILVAEHHGDTRGETWVTELTCLSVDPTAANTGQSVKAYG